MFRFELVLVIVSTAVATAVVVDASPERRLQLPGADLKAIQPVASEPVHDSPAGTDVARVHQMDVAGMMVPLDLSPFAGCSDKRAREAHHRVAAAFECSDLEGASGTTPTRQVLELGSAFPFEVADVTVVASEVTPVLVLPSPKTARLAADARFNALAAGAATLGKQADSLPDAAMAVYFAPQESAGNMIHLPPTPRGHVISPGVFKYAWASMNRAVLTRGGASGLSPNKQLSEVAADFLAESRVRPGSTLWSLPVNEHVQMVTLVDGGASQTRVAWSMADGVAGYRPGDPVVRLNGETAMTVVFDSPAHSPEGPRGYSLLRIPAANAKPRGPGVVPGERIALDEWFAEPPRGFAALIHTDASIPGHPAYRISIAPDDLRDPAVRNRIEVIAIFEGISDAMLQAVVEAYLGLPEN